MEGLDIRILSITILLSLVFFARALVDCMFAFNLINEQLSSYVMSLIIVIFTEVCTACAVVKLMKKGQKSAKTGAELATSNSYDDIDNHYKRPVNDHNRRAEISFRKHHKHTSH